MSAPPQRRPNKAKRAQRDEQIFRMKIAGKTEREIAAEVRLSQTRVNEILTAQVAARVGPPAEAYVAMREAELHDLWVRAHEILADKGSNADTKIKALTTAVRISESRRKLRGADAPDSLRVQLDHRVDEESAIIAEAIIAGLKAISLPPDREMYALEAAGARLKALEGDAAYEAPEPLPPEPAGTSVCTPYTESGAMFIDGPPGSGIRYRVVATMRQPPPTVSQDDSPPGPSAPTAQQRDSAAEVLDVLAHFETEFGPLDDDEDGTGGTGAEGA